MSTTFLFQGGGVGVRGSKDDEADPDDDGVFGGLEGAEVPAPPAPHAAPRAPRRPRGGHARGVADVVFEMPQGRISFYDRYKRFEATCYKHELCRLTRQANENPNHAAQGRPLGLLWAWLNMSEDLNDVSEHINVWVLMLLDYERRLAARLELRTFPNAEALFDAERPAREGEDEPHTRP